MAKKDRFDLEQEIMVAWNTCDDIKLVISLFDNLDLTKPKDVDRILNLLVGIQELHQVKMETVFGTFEQLIGDKKIK